MHYIVGGIEGLAGYVDYCCADQISRLELIYMAREFNLEVEGCSLWWLDVTSGHKGLKEIQTNLDALSMALSVGSSKEIIVYIKINSRGHAHGVGPSSEKGKNILEDEDQEEGEELDEENTDVEGELLGRDVRGKKDADDSYFHDSDYTFSDSEHDGNDTSDRSKVIVSVGPTMADDEDVETDYAGSEELHSCSSTDEDDLAPTKPRYSEFNEDFDMKNPEFRIGMKFRSFAQFKEAVRNYGIKNRYVMNFRPNSKTRCKAFCKKGCPFYLWASPMVKDSSTIQIKSGKLQHECARDHHNRHVNAEWIAKTYLEQFRADPSWKIPGIVQAVKTNQQVDISRLKAYRAKSKALR